MDPRYTHYFDTRIAIHFESDIEDFDEAFNAWMDSLPGTSARRRALTEGDESVTTLREGVIWSETVDSLDS